MSRADRRRAEKENQKKEAVYTLTRGQLENMIQDELAKAKKEGYHEGLNHALLLTLAMPCDILMKYYWQKTYTKKLPGFVQHLLDYYSAWLNGSLDIEALKTNLYENGGIKFIEEDV